MLEHGIVRALRGIWIAALAIALVAMTASPAQAALNGFEGGDGNQVASCASSRDWQCVPSGAIIAGRDETGATDVGFIGGSKETDPDGWTFAAEAIQDKADIRGVFGLVESAAAGRSYLHVAFVRGGGSGDTYVGIELNQFETTWINSAGSTIPCRTDGDLLLSYEASNQVSIGIYRWTGAGGPASCPDGRTGTWTAAAGKRETGIAFEGAMNTGPIANHLGTDTFGSTLAPAVFGEASVDLRAVADVFGESSGCSYFRRMSVKTRSASSLDSSLQDWAAGSQLFARSCATPDPGGDPTPPAVPVVISPSSTCSLPLVVNGTAEPGATVTVYDGLRSAGFSVANASGQWQLSLTSLTDGTHSLSAEATDAAGNTSARSAAATVAVDATTPAAPVLEVKRAGVGIAELSGTAEPGLQVTIRENGKVVATATAGPDGRFATTLMGVDMQRHVYVATVADACHTSAASAPASLADEMAPAAPTVTVAASSCQLPLVVSGTAEPGSTVTVYNASAMVGSAVANGSGDWSLTLSTLADGSHSLSADARDAAGNLSLRSTAATAAVDTTAPAAPELHAERTGTNSVRLWGTAEAGREVTIREDGHVVATVTAGNDGTFETTITGVSAGEDHSYVARVRDACRTSAASAAATVTDAVAPNAPTVTVAASSCQLPLVVSGTAEPGSKVTVHEGDTTLGSTDANGSGEWSLTLSTLADGSHTLSADARDTAGNTSQKSAPVTAAVDTTAPAAPELHAERQQDGGVKITGSADPGGEVTVREGSAIVATVTAGPDGKFSVVLADATADAHEYVARVRDACGRASAMSSVAGVSDTSAPDAPDVSLAAASTCTLPLTVAGKTEPGAAVTLYKAQAVLGTAVAGPEGSWNVEISDLSDGEHQLSAQARDAAGNASALASVRVTVDRTAPAAPVLQATRLDAGSVRLTGAAEPGVAVAIKQGDRSVARLTVGQDGRFATTLSGVAPEEQIYVATVSDACRTSSESAVAKAAAAPTDTPVEPLVTGPAGPIGQAPQPRVGESPSGEITPEFRMGTVTKIAECRHTAFRAYVTRKGVRVARFYVDGVLTGTVRKPDSRGFFVTTIDPAKYAPGAHTLTARVKFRKRGKRPVQLKLRFRRCDECQSRRSFRIRVPHLRHGERAVRATVFVNGKRVRVVKGKRLRARVVLTGLPRGTYRIRIIARTNRGRIHRSTRTYRTCVGKRPTKPERKRSGTKRP